MHSNVLEGGKDFLCFLQLTSGEKFFRPYTSNVVTLASTNTKLHHLRIFSVHCYKDDIYIIVHWSTTRVSNLTVQPWENFSFTYSETYITVEQENHIYAIFIRICVYMLLLMFYPKRIEYILEWNLLEKSAKLILKENQLMKQAGFIIDQ